MKLKRYLVVLLLLTITPTLFSQTNLDYLRFGDYAFEQKNYASAAFYYSKILGENPDGNLPALPYDPIKCKIPPSPKRDSMLIAQGLKVINKYPDKPIELSVNKYHFIVHRLADSYRLSFNYEYAEKWYGKTIELELQQFPLAKFWYATMLKSNEKYKDASKYFVEFVNEYHESQSYYTKKSQKEIAGCAYAIDQIEHPRNDGVTIINHGFLSPGSNISVSINPTDSFAIYYSSSKTYEEEEEEEKLKTRLQEKPQFFDIYTSSQTELGWSMPKKLSGETNTAHHDFAPFVSHDGNKLFFTRTTTDSKNPETAIYLSKNVNGNWTPPQKLNEKINMPGFKSMHATLSLDGRHLYFSSNRPGGQGRMDIWVSILDENDEPSTLENLGERVNTEEDEISPFFHYQSLTLYFSSNGRIGMGGYDIYKALQGNYTWAEPENMKYPINSGKDDMYYSLSSKESFAYLASDRDGSCECISGYCFNVYKVKPKPVIITLSGTVYKESNKKPLSNVLIIIEDNLGNNQAILTDDDGFYKIELNENTSYYLKTKKSTYFSAAAAVNTEGIYVSTDLVQDFYMERIPIGEIEIPGILYDYDSADLRVESKLILDDLGKFLKLTDNITIEIASHTDDRGNDDYNFKLSGRRAKSVLIYLIELGIEKPRLSSVGHGETKLLVIDAETEDEHQKNRRTTFRILSEEYSSGI
ncbi:MAG: hypothetical protein COC01_10255 [Bacteroidetes bacterium]|nr:MAG: hypothetical protein COC01_10255 [Bacteroidota bacterium]